eukprot:CAMPEP_0183481466 /NCGR_PEP_ID=MMETSP0370-20130417/174996_1 /TAXON_ID=268820 /ORGANISM="Peridinium aciculiferum, Strain PAER-2" /LENGTH=81 /DNA_ID=CAMNT_0025674595 /DNA_START=10 /DNA_END=252 /DNA_ORIENTATION=-
MSDHRQNGDLDTAGRQARGGERGEGGGQEGGAVRATDLVEDLQEHVVALSVHAHHCQQQRDQWHAEKKAAPVTSPHAATAA